ncbi:MAG: hypothetical protein ACHBN1_25865 [Heteroscytonema crispum UTEX LB 1556]
MGQSHSHNQKAITSLSLISTKLRFGDRQIAFLPQMLHETGNLL